MSEREAIERATEFARERGRDTARYRASAESRGGEWVIDFKPSPAGRKSMPGDFFTVYDEDATGEAQMAEGK
jgi:hypothetical protein